MVWTHQDAVVRIQSRTFSDFIRILWMRAICTLFVLVTLASVASVASAQTSPPVPVLRLGRQVASLDGAPVSIPGDPGFAGRPASSATPLTAALGRATAIRIVLARDTDVLRFSEAITAIRAASVVRYELEVAGRRAGPFTILAAGETADLEVGDLYMGGTTPRRQSASTFRANGRGVAKQRIVFVLDYGTTAPELLATLTPAQGSSIRVAFHTGPF